MYVFSMRGFHTPSSRVSEFFSFAYLVIEKHCSFCLEDTTALLVNKDEPKRLFLVEEKE